MAFTILHVGAARHTSSSLPNIVKLCAHVGNEMAVFYAGEGIVKHTTGTMLMNSLAAANMLSAHLSVITQTNFLSSITTADSSEEIHRLCPQYDGV